MSQERTAPIRMQPACLCLQHARRACIDPPEGRGGVARSRERADRAYEAMLDGLIARHSPLLIELSALFYRLAAHDGFSLPPGPPERSEIVWRASRARGRG